MLALRFSQHHGIAENAMIVNALRTWQQPPALPLANPFYIEITPHQVTPPEVPLPVQLPLPAISREPSPLFLNQEDPQLPSLEPFEIRRTISQQLVHAAMPSTSSVSYHVSSTSTDLPMQKSSSNESMPLVSPTLASTTRGIAHDFENCANCKKYVSALVAVHCSTCLASFHFECVEAEANDFDEREFVCEGCTNWFRAEGVFTDEINLYAEFVARNVEEATAQLNEMEGRQRLFASLSPFFAYVLYFSQNEEIPEDEEDDAVVNEENDVADVSYDTCLTQRYRPPGELFKKIHEFLL